jgi:hypothetical protein
MRAIQIFMLLFFSVVARSQTSPGPKDHFSMIYNPDRKSFLHRNCNDNPVTLLEDMWLWNGKKWKLLK